MVEKEKLEIVKVNDLWIVRAMRDRIVLYRSEYHNDCVNFVYDMIISNSELYDTEYEDIEYM